jgi:hypothetical protein
MKFSSISRIVFQSFLFVITFAFINQVYSQCGFQATCPNTDYLNFGMGSNTNAATIEYDNFIMVKVLARAGLKSIVHVKVP